MNCRPSIVTGILACLVVFGQHRESGAQTIKGSLFGVVRDESGAAIAAATVTLTSQVLRGETRSVRADTTGRFRLIDLPQGSYTLIVSVPSRVTYREEGLEVRAGVSLARTVTLHPSDSEEVVTSRAPALELDWRRSSFSTSFGPTYLNETPRLRFSYYDPTKIAPGVTPESASSMDMDLVSSMGSGVDENVYLLDGIDVTAPFSGSSGPSPDPNIVEAVEILATGAPADYGNVPGGVFNVVTRRGGPEYAFDFNLYTQPSALATDGAVIDCDCPEGKTGFVRHRYRDLSFHLGGPLREGDAWFFAGFQHFRDYASQSGTDPAFPSEFKTDRLFLKIDWNFSPRIRLTHSYHADIWRRPQVPSRESPFGSQVTFGGHNASAAFADITYERSENTAGYLRVSGFFAPNDFTEPNNGDLTKPFRFDAIQGRASGGARGFGNFQQKRIEVRANVSHYARDFLSRDHDFKFGIQMAGGSHRGLYGYPGGARYYDNSGYAAANYALIRDPFSYGGQSRHFGIFVDDVVSLGDRLTMSLGLRFDHQSATSQDIPAVDAMGNELGGTIPGAGPLFSWNNLSPRVGFTYRLTDKTLVRLSYARLHRGVLTRELDPFHPGNTLVTGAVIDPTTGGYSNVVSVTDPTANLSVDPDIGAPRTDEVALTLERRLSSGLVGGLTLVRKRGRDPVGWIDAGGVYGTDSLLLPSGEALTVHPRLNGAEEQLFLLTNPPGWRSDYDGLVLRAGKDWSHRWRASFSYTFSKAEGLVSSNQPFVQGAEGLSFAGVPQRSDGALVFGRDPNDLTNARGKLRGDRTHVLRLEGSLLVPWVDVLMGLHYHHLTGKPWAGFALVPLPQGVRPVYLEAPGVRRLPSQDLLDVRFSKSFRPEEVVLFDWMGRVPPFQWMGQTRAFRALGGARMELVADVFNAVEDRAFEEVATSSVVSPHFGAGTRFIAPRRVMIGLKVAF